MGRAEERELFLSTGRSIDLLKSTVPEWVMNVKLKSAPRAALQSGVYVTAALTVPPSIAVTITLSMPWVPADKENGSYFLRHKIFNFMLVQA